MEKAKVLPLITAICSNVYAAIFIVLGILGLSNSSPIPADGFLGGLTVLFFYASLIFLIGALVYAVITILYLLCVLKNWKLGKHISLLTVLVVFAAISLIISIILVAASLFIFIINFLFSVGLLTLSIMCLVAASKAKKQQLAAKRAEAVQIEHNKIAEQKTEKSKTEKNETEVTASKKE